MTINELKTELNSLPEGHEVCVLVVNYLKGDRVTVNEDVVEDWAIKFKGMRGTVMDYWEYNSRTEPFEKMVVYQLLMDNTLYLQVRDDQIRPYMPELMIWLAPN